MAKTFIKTGSSKTSSIYVSENEKLIITPSNQTQKNKPTYYLNGGRPPHYISGLFATKNPAIFSGDIKHPITGIKQLFKITFKDQGETLVLDGMA